MEVTCNSCWSKTEGRAFKSPCHHIFCERCATKHFSRSLECPACARPAKSSSDITEFQVVGEPIPDIDLLNVQGMILSITAANGAGWVAYQAEMMHKIQLIQCEARMERKEQNVLQLRRERENREKEFMNSQLQTNHAINTLESKCEQLEKSLEGARQASEALQNSLEDKTRQMQNWKSMYESLKSSEGTGSSNVNAAQNRYAHNTEKRNTYENRTPNPNGAIVDEGRFSLNGHMGNNFQRGPGLSLSASDAFHKTFRRPLSGAGVRRASSASSLFTMRPPVPKRLGNNSSRGSVSSRDKSRRPPPSPLPDMFSRPPTASGRDRDARLKRRSGRDHTTLSENITQAENPSLLNATFGTPSKSHSSRLGDFLRRTEATTQIITSTEGGFGGSSLSSRGIQRRRL